MSRFLIKSTPRMTPAGGLGVGLFVLAPIVASFSYLAWYGRGTYDTGFGQMVLIALALVLWLVGFVMMFTGRSFAHEVTVLTED